VVTGRPVRPPRLVTRNTSSALLGERVGVL